MAERSYPGRGRQLKPTTPLARAILHRGLKMYEVGALAHIAPRQMHDLVNGKREMSNDQRNALSRVLRVPADAL